MSLQKMRETLQNGKTDWFLTNEKLFFTYKSGDMQI